MLWINKDEWVPRQSEPLEQDWCSNSNEELQVVGLYTVLNRLLIPLSQVWLHRDQVDQLESLQPEEDSFNIIRLALSLKSLSFFYAYLFRTIDPWDFRSVDSRLIYNLQNTFK